MLLVDTAHSAKNGRPGPDLIKPLAEGSPAAPGSLRKFAKIISVDILTVIAVSLKWTYPSAQYPMYVHSDHARYAEYHLLTSLPQATQPRP